MDASGARWPIRPCVDMWWLPGAGTGRPREPHHGHEYKIIKLY